jgi:PAS domain S-box-containing protein
MINSISFNRTQFSRLFPFFILIDNELGIIDFGESIGKLCSLEIGSPFTSIFSFERPKHDITSYNDLELLHNQLVILHHQNNKNTILKGQFEIIQKDSRILFVGSPWFGSIDQLTSTGLTLNDFATHDSTIDLLHVIKVQENTNQDIKELLTTVSEQKNRLKRLSLVAQKTQNAVIVTDKDGYIEWVNNGFERITGYTLREVLSKKPGDILQGKDTDPNTIKYLRSQIMKGLPFNCEIINYHKNGEPYWVRINGQPLFDDQGTISQYFAIEEDISESKRLSMSVHTAVARLRTLISNLSDAVLLENEQRKIEIINSRFCEIFKIPLSPELLVGTDCSQAAEQSKHLFKNEDEFVARIEEILSTRKLVVADQLELKDGRFFERDFIPIIENDIYLGHLWVYSDITERKKYDSTLRSQRQFYENILNKIPSDIAVFDTEHRYLFVNPVGIKNAEIREWIIGKTDYDYCERRKRPRSIADDRRKLFNAVLESKELKVWEEEVVRPDGKKEYYLRNMYPVLDDNNNVTMVIGYGLNITERKKAEKEIADALVQQQELNELKSRFVSMISHEFRTPLSTILSSTQLLERYWDTFTEEKRRKHFPKIETAVSRMTALLDDVLFIGRTDTNKLIFSPIPIDIYNFCTEVIEEVSMSGYGTDRVQFTFEGNSTDVVVDEKLLRHIIVNLLSNAHKYSPKTSSIVFSVVSHSEKIIFTITDYGIGIPPEDQERLFEVFHRATNVGNVQGTGLGLSIVKRSVDIHGGTISVNSTIGIGTTFIVTIPVGNTTENIPQQH